MAHACVRGRCGRETEHSYWEITNHPLSESDFDSECVRRSSMRCTQNDVRLNARPFNDISSQCNDVVEANVMFYFISAR